MSDADRLPLIPITVRRAAARRRAAQLRRADRRRARGVRGERRRTRRCEDIARRANVGIGTLYRNFPTRQDLFTSVYVGGVEELLRRGARARRRWSRGTAFAAWLERFTDYIATKMAMKEALEQGLARCSAPAARRCSTPAVPLVHARAGGGRDPRGRRVRRRAADGLGHRRRQLRATTRSAPRARDRARRARRCARRGRARRSRAARRRRAGAARSRAAPPGLRRALGLLASPRAAARAASSASAAARASISSRVRGRGLGLAARARRRRSAPARFDERLRELRRDHEDLVRARPGRAAGASAGTGRRAAPGRARRRGSRRRRSRSPSPRPRP